MKRFSIELVVGLACALGVSSTWATEPSDGPQKLIFCGSRRPVLIELEIEVDGQPYRETGRELAASQFAELDQNGDGVLSPDEATSDNVKDLFRAFFSDKLDKPRLAQLAAAEKIDAARFARYCEETLIRPFRIEVEYDSAQSDGALWSVLDQDHSGSLSRDELARAAASLALRDFDDDGAISRLDLMSSPLVGGSSAGGSGPFIVVDAGVDLPGELLARYDRNHDGQLAALGTDAEIDVDEAAQRALDANLDLRLDRQELARFADREADIRLGFALGRGGAAGDRFSKDRRVKQKLDGSYQVSLDEGVILIRRNNRNPADMLRDYSFSSFDRDNNNYIDAKELEGGDFAGDFALLDANGDGMAPRDEFKQFLDKRGRGGSMRLVFRVAHGGRKLFDVFDKNLDGAISAREVQSAGNLFRKHDLDGDGQISERELPAHFECELGRLATSPTAMAMPRGPAPRRQSREAESADGPTWFARMDRNRDGDVSRREFLGPLSKFDELDADSDGLLSGAEAGRAR